ncbi:myb-binding protein 1A [Phymastichus coffea]|uniref:myb-binding protein 1A n=1 Tax=Phymastichus coffea TaxID=108790 RepID=UPI00273BFC2E|nr:myb-binding protein 1A [Phymastichus coffea]
MASTVFDCFSKLLKDNTNERLNGGYRLLQHLDAEIQKNGESKEFNHTLQRLIRGLGSSKIASRKGFYTTFTVYLSLNPDTSVDKIFNIMDIELKTSSSSTKSEVADVNNGRILACGAIIRSGILKNLSLKDQKKVLECLFNSGKIRSYLSFESVSFIVEFLKQLEDENSLTPLWPIFEKEICTPFKEQNLDSFYVLLVIQDKFPQTLTKKVLQTHLGYETIVNKESIEDIVKILTNIPRVMCYKHPVYELFCEKLVASDCVEQFWSNIDQCFIKPSKTDEFLGVELFNILLNTTKDESIIVNLLSPHFLRHILKRFSYSAIHRNDDVSIGFRKALTQLVTVLSENTKSKVHFNVIKKLILYPGDLMIEKITNTKVLQMITSQMGSDGLKKLANLYKEIAANTKFKEKANGVKESWTNNERTYVTQLLATKLISHKAMISDHEWRLEQLKFLFNNGLCDMSNVGIELAPYIKESFYRALDTKLESLTDLRTVLSTLVTYINETIFENSEVKLRVSLDQTAKEAWVKMLKLVEKLDKGSKFDHNINAVFHMMILHMGLQLFSDPKMAISSINELHSCYEHLKEKKKSKKHNSSKVIDDDLEWVEVVVDLLLSLLSRQSHLLRSLVGCVFPHICPHLTANAIHQILAILDIKSGKNPLSCSKNEDDESESDNEDEEEDDDDKNESESDEEENSEDDESDEENDIDIEESDAENETVTDRLRLAVSQALGDVAMQTDDEDIDVDNIDEEEGKRLDESLAAAFKILKENHAKTQSKKQEKDAQALTHFRIRVIDLLECYLDNSPSMALALDMLVPLFALLEFTIKDQHQKPLQNRVRTCLKKLSLVKKFQSIEDVNGELLTIVLKTLIVKGERSAAVCQEMGDKLAQCCVFLVRCSQQVEGSTDSFIKIFGENLSAYFKKRDCILPAILFKSLLQLCWVGNWHLVPLLVDFAFDESVRSYKRGQALDFLKTFYSNTRIINADDHKNTRLKMEKRLCQSSISILVELSATQETENGKQISKVVKDLKQKFICNLLLLLFTIETHHIPEAWDWTKIGECMAAYRSSNSLSNDAKSAYNKLANRIHAPVTSKQQVKIPRLSSENHDSDSSEDEIQNSDSHNDSQIETTKESQKKNDKKRKKNSSKKKNKQKLKKEARELRAKAMSEGLESLDFSNVYIPNGISSLDEPVTNGVPEEMNSKKEKNKKYKRSHGNSTDIPSKKKKKDSQNGD